MVKNYLFTLSFAGIFLGAIVCCADSYSGNDSTVVNEPAAPTVPSVEDPRLPPVIPGQELSAGGGRRVRMISTAGPVVVSSPVPTLEPSLEGLSGAQIVVDTRGGGPRDEKK